MQFPSKVLIRAVKGGLVVTVNGTCTRKPMTPQQFIDLAEDCLKAAREMERETQNAP